MSGAGNEPFGRPALVTGASSGIGAAYARELARLGMAPVLVARRAARLERLAAELAERHHVRATALPADLARADGVDRVCARLGELPALGALVHAAGFGTRGHFVEVTPEKSRDMVSLHVLAAVRLTRAALPAMLEAGRGDLVYISSLVAESRRGLDRGQTLYVPGLANRLFVGAMHTPLVGRLLRAGLDQLSRA